ncbi:MAG: iron complex outermembrane receptor protein, partial [Maricaulis maris]
MKKFKTLTGTALLLSTVAASALVAAPAVAQDNGASEGRDVITVTARRREETLQDVPLSVTAMTGEDLERMGALDIVAIADTTPNITLEVSRGTNSTLSAFIRGVGQQDPVAGFEAGVGIYVDDVYLNRPQGAVLDIYDVDRIEVLRGPQGTLYGRNTIGGAVKYVTRRIDADEPTLSARLGFGSYGQLDTVLSGSAPLSDTFRVGGTLGRFTRDGYGE